MFSVPRWLALLGPQHARVAGAVADGRGHGVAQRLQALPEAGAILRGIEDGSPAGTASDLAQAARARPGQTVDWGLGVVVTPAPDGGHQLDIALAGANGVFAQTMGYGGHPDLAIRWAATSALNLLRLALTRGVWPPA